MNIPSPENSISHGKAKTLTPGQTEGFSKWAAYGLAVLPLALKMNFALYESENKKSDLATEVYLPTKAGRVVIDVARCKYCQCKTVQGTAP